MLHAIWLILINNKKRYAHYSETIRWKGKQKALYLRYEQLVNEMMRRGYHHHSPLELSFATGYDQQDVVIDSYEKQVHLLQQKKCECTV